MNVLIIAGVASALAMLLCFNYKVADIDRALVITGGKKPIIKVSGGSFVMPLFRKAQYVELCIQTVKSDGNEAETFDSIPVMVDWTAQIRPNAYDMESMRKAVKNFEEDGVNGVLQNITMIMNKAVRDVVASMTAEELIKNKALFAHNISDKVTDQIQNMGMEFVAMNIQKVSDKNHYYEDMAAAIIAEKEQAAIDCKMESQNQTEAEWVCPYCSNSNKSDDLNCHGCGAPKIRNVRKRNNGYLSEDMLNLM